MIQQLICLGNGGKDQNWIHHNDGGDVDFRISFFFWGDLFNDISF